MPSFEDRLKAALNSRQQRQILRKLPPPQSDYSHSDPGLTFIDFYTNDYLSFSRNMALRERFLQKLRTAPTILGSGGSRLLVNGSAHSALEDRLASFFGSPAALLFNTGFDANVGFFSCIPQNGDVVVYDEYIHASVHDGIRASRAGGHNAHFSFSHNSVASLQNLLLKLLRERSSLRTGANSLIVAVETLYSMEGSFSPLSEISLLLDTLFPKGNGYLVVDEAHATGLYGTQGRGIVSLLGLENRILARVHTFGKALASSGAVILTSPLIKEYLLNYARPLIYTTSLSYTTIIAIDCSFDLLENGTAAKLAAHMIELSGYFTLRLQQLLETFPSDLIFVPRYISESQMASSVFSPSGNKACMFSPIIPIMTPYPRSLSTYLDKLGFIVRPIMFPTVPKGKDRVRVCLHANKTKDEVEGLIQGIVRWAESELSRSDRERAIETLRTKL